MNEEGKKEPGVDWRPDKELWAVRANFEGKKVFLGYFRTKKDAVRFRSNFLGWSASKKRAFLSASRQERSRIRGTWIRRDIAINYATAEGLRESPNKSQAMGTINSGEAQMKVTDRMKILKKAFDAMEDLQAERELNRLSGEGWYDF